jgi:heavy metal sensor kinase
MRSRLRRTRVRLTLIYTAAFAVVVVVSTGAFWTVLYQAEYRTIDATLAEQAQEVISNRDTGGGRMSISGGERLPTETPGGIAVTALLFGPDLGILDTSGPVKNADAYRSVAASFAADPGVRTVDIGGRHERVRGQRVEFEDGTKGVLLVARPVDELEQSLVRAGLLLAAVDICLVLGAAWLGYWLSGRALEPVRLMSETARDISEHDLKRRIELDLPEGDEIGELAATLNAMLGRLEAAFQSLRQFTADAAHELRAPLALMRTQVDVILRHDRSPEEYRESHRALLTEIERLSRLADQLLLLARADAGALETQRLPVDVSDLVEETVDRWRPRALERKVRLEASTGDQPMLAADPDLLRRLLDNLLDNGLRHTPPGGRVALQSWQEGGTVRLQVEDSGPGVDDRLAGRIFDRFTRADDARARDSGGSGLGLALAAAIVQAHGGSIHLENRPEPGIGARFVVALPITEAVSG